MVVGVAVTTVLKVFGWPAQPPQSTTAVPPPEPITTKEDAVWSNGTVHVAFVPPLEVQKSLEGL